MPGGVRVYEADGSRELWKVDGSYTGASFSPDGRRMVTVSITRGVRVFDVQGGRELWAADGVYLSASYNPDGSRVAAAGQSGARVFEAEGGRELWKADGPYRGVSFGPNGLALCGNYGVQFFGGVSDLVELTHRRRQGLNAGRARWHAVGAVLSEDAGQFFVNEFHLRWLAHIHAELGGPQFRHGLVLARLGRNVEARQAFDTALRLKGTLGPQTIADSHAMLGQWNEAVALYSGEVTPKTADPRLWLRHAQLALVARGPAEYRSVCQTMLDRLGKTTDSATANTIAWTCAIGPDSLKDMKRPVELARMAVKAQPLVWNVHGTLGAVLYRAGESAEAEKELESAIRLHDKGGSPLTHLFLAMTQHRRGNADAAVVSLAAAEKLLAQDPAWFWTDKLERQLLRDEATALIRMK
jgi:Flp pilus assembly protein TadD